MQMPEDAMQMPEGPCRCHADAGIFETQSKEI